MRPGVTSRTRKKQVCPCLNLCAAPTCSCVFVCKNLIKRRGGGEIRNNKKRCVTLQHAHNNMFTHVARARCSDACPLQPPLSASPPCS